MAYQTRQRDPFLDGPPPVLPIAHRQGIGQVGAGHRGPPRADQPTPQARAGNPGEGPLAEGPGVPRDPAR